MGRYLSDALRVRVIQAIDAGQSRRSAAERYGVRVSSAIRWVSDFLDDGRSCAKLQGGDQRSERIELHHTFRMDAIEEVPDITLTELCERLIEEHGETFAVSTIDGFFRRHGVSYKKDCACQRTGARRCSCVARGLVRASTRS